MKFHHILFLFGIITASILFLSVSTVQADYDAALSLFKDKKYSEAIPLLEEWCQKYPKDPRGAYTLAQCYMKTKQNSKAIDRLSIILEHHPGHAPSQFLMGMLIAAKSPANAITHFQKAMDAQPDNEQYAYFLGSTLVAEKRYAEAETALKKAISINPKNGKAHFDLGRVLLFSEKAEESIKHLQLATKGADKASAFFYLGMAQLQTKDVDGAVTSFTEASKLSPDDAKVFFNLGIALESQSADAATNMESFQPQIDAYSKACNLDTSVSDYHFRLGNAYESAVRKIYTQTAGNDTLSKKALEYLAKAKDAYIAAGSDAAKDRITGVEQMIANIKNPQIIEEVVE